MARNFWFSVHDAPRTEWAQYTPQLYADMLSRLGTLQFYPTTNGISLYHTFLQIPAKCGN